MAEPTRDPVMAQLHRFLYLGDETKPYPACISFPFTSEKIQSIFDTSGKEMDMICEIVRVFREDRYLGLEPIIYALAVFAHSKDVNIKQASLKAVSDVCVSATAMFTFTYIYRELSKPSKGWGRGHRKVLKDWYNSKEAKDLATEVTKVRSYRKWSHKDILCMAHVKAVKPENGAVLEYLVKGYDNAVKDYSSQPEAEPVLKYLKAINDVNQASEGETVARLIEINDLCLEQLPSKIVKTKEVSLCLIPRVPIKNLTRLIPQYCKLGLLKLNSPHYKALLERLNSEEAQTDSSIDPLESFLAIRKWQLGNRLVPGKPLLRQNTPAIDDALQNLHLASFKSVIPTQKRYLVAVDIRPTMSQSACAGCRYVTPSNVSEILLLALVKAELSNVTVLVFSPEELVSVDINNKMTIADVNEHISKVVPGSVNLAAPPQWALTKKKPYDLLVVFTDRLQDPDVEGCTAAFKEYKDTLHLSNTRYIISALCDTTPLSLPEDPDILNIIGFNIKLLKIIQDFACGIF